MKIALWFMDISQTITCSSMADSDLGFIAVYSRHCLTAPSEDDYTCIVAAHVTWDYSTFVTK